MSVKRTHGEATTFPTNDTVLEFTCVKSSPKDVKKPKPQPCRIIAVPANLTFYNLMRVLLYSFRYKGDQGFDYHFELTARGRTLKVGKGSKFDLKENQVEIGRYCNYLWMELKFFYGELQVDLSLSRAKYGLSRTTLVSWFPRVCEGSVGKFPTESKCKDKEFLDKYGSNHEFKMLNSINSVLMVTKFGKNKTQNKQKKKGPRVYVMKGQNPKPIILNVMSKRINADSSDGVLVSDERSRTE